MLQFMLQFISYYDCLNRTNSCLNFLKAPFVSFVTVPNPNTSKINKTPLNAVGNVVSQVWYAPSKVSRQVATLGLLMITVLPSATIKADMRSESLKNITHLAPSPSADARCKDGSPQH